MNEIQKKKQYDLEDRTFNFVKNVRTFIKQIPTTLSNIEDAKQLVKASGSVGANYIEATKLVIVSNFEIRYSDLKKEIS